MAEPNAALMRPVRARSPNPPPDNRLDWNTFGHAEQYATVIGIPEAPIDGTMYGRQDGQWMPGMPVAGGTMTGALILYADPEQPLEAATKQYIDARSNVDGGVY